jgi:hypothetical protein
MHMLAVCCPDNPADLALAESLLAAEGISYFVHNRHFSGLFPGVQIRLYNVSTVMVPEADLLRSREVLADLLMAIEPESPQAAVSRPRISMGHKFRMVLEFLFFGRFVPPQRRWKNDETSDGGDGANISHD